MRYRYLLADNDNTLMDFHLAERRAFGETMRFFALPDDDGSAAAYAAINRAMWLALERGEMTQDVLRTERFRRFLGALGRADLNAAAVADRYEEQLSRHGETLDGAVELLQKAKAAGMKIALVSNGVACIQRGRLAVCGFAHLLDGVYISAETGFSKPDPGMITLALKDLGCTDKAEAVFLGDSLTADIAAARAAGIDSLWLSPSGAASPLPTHTVRTPDEAWSWLSK